METKRNDIVLRKKLYTVVIACFAVSYALYCFVLSPLFFWLSSDISFYGTVLPTVVQYAGIAIELIAISVFYGVMIYGMYRFGGQGFNGCIGIYAVAAACKYLANVVMTWITYYSAIPRGWPWDIANVVFYTALEMIQLWIVIAVIKRIFNNQKSGALELVGIYDKTNPFMRCALACGIVTVAVKVFGRLMDDVWTMIISGLPKNPMTVVLMLLSYLSVTLLGVICYAVTVFVIGRILSAERIE